MRAFCTTHSDFPGHSVSFKFKQNITGSAEDDGTKNVEIIVSLKYLSNFWGALEMSSINYEINLISTWSDKCVLSNDTKVTTFAINDSL